MQDSLRFRRGVAAYRTEAPSVLCCTTLQCVIVCYRLLSLFVCYQYYYHCCYHQYYYYHYMYTYTEREREREKEREIFIYIYIYTHTYVQRERERERDCAQYVMLYCIEVPMPPRVAGVLLFAACTLRRLLCYNLLCYILL